MSRPADKRPWALAVALAAALAATFAGGARASHNALEQVSLGPDGGNAAMPTQWVDASADGTRVLLRTVEPLAAADTDVEFDIYERTAAGTTTQVSTGPAGGNMFGADAFYEGSSADGTHVFFETLEPLVASDTDDCAPADPQANPCTDVYEWSNGTTTLASAGGNGPYEAQYRGASEDGSRVFFTTSEPISGSDTDSQGDLYERAGGTTTLLSTGPAGGNGARDALVKAWSAGGTRVFIQTAEQLAGADTDSALDVYERSGGTTTLVSTGPAGGNGPTDALLQDVSDDGSRVVIGTAESLVGSDTDGRIDLYERAGGATTLLSTGPSGGNGNFDAFFSAASKDGGRVFFETAEPLSGDTDAYPDVYERAGGTTTRLSFGTGGGNGAQTAVFTGASEDGYRVWFASAEQLASTDTDSGTDIFEVRPTASYPRPKGATPMKIPLVVAYDQCTSPNRLHGPPAFGGGGPDPSCHPPQPASGFLTVGTGDSNGQPTKSSGFVLLDTVVGNPTTTTDEADVRMTLDLSDVRVQGTLADYTGELQVNFTLRMVDKYNGSTPVDAATVSGFTASFTATCTGTPDTTVGATCSASTTADALVPGAAVEGVRTIWQAGQVQVLDGGADGAAATTPNTPFMRQGIFIP